MHSAATLSFLPGFTIAQGSAIQMAASHRGEFVRFAIADPRKKNCTQVLRKHLEAGARGIGEMKFPVECDSPKMECVYELAHQFRVPVLVHFEEGAFNKGFNRFARMASRIPTLFSSATPRLGGATSVPAIAMNGTGLTLKEEWSLVA